MSLLNILGMRHGLSAGNVNPDVYMDMQDHNVPLDAEGHWQAIRGGRTTRAFALANDLRDFRIWHSPMCRTVETTEHFVTGFGHDLIHSIYEDERLREQDFGLFSDIYDRAEQKRLFPEEYAKYQRCREQQGIVYARPPMGESRLDVVLRTRQFIETMMRDYHHDGISNVIIISHGVTVRALEMAFLHRGIEWLEKSTNPNNCQINRIYGSRDGGYRSEVLDCGFKL